MEDATRIRSLLTSFQTALKARKGKTVTTPLIAQYDSLIQTFNTEFPKTPVPPPVEPPPVPPPVVIPPATPIIAPILRDPSPYPDPQGNTVHVPYTGGIVDLDTPYANAAPGTTITTDAAGIYSPVKARSKATDVPVVIRPKLDLPLTRLNTKALPFQLPRIVANADGAITTLPGAHSLMLMGMELYSPALINTIANIGTTLETKLEELPDNIWFDRVWVHSDPLKGTAHGLALNGRKSVVIRSYIDDIWCYTDYKDSWGISSWSGLGPYWIEDNYIAAAGENVVFGGNDPRVPGVIPSGLVFRRNNCVKPLTWKTRRGTVKNLFELKNMRGALVEENEFTNSWVDAQAGHGMVLNVRNQDGTRNDSTLSDIVVRYNLMRNLEGYAFNLLGQDDEHVSTKARNLSISNNLVLNAVNAFIVQRGWDNLTIDHNTFVGLSYHLLGLAALRDATGKVLPSDLMNGFKMVGNVAGGFVYNFVGAVEPGIKSLAAYASPDYLVSRNVFERSASRPDDSFPDNNILLAPGTLKDYLNVDRSVKTGSIADIISTDNKTVGVDIATLKTKMSGLGVTW